MTTIIPIVNYDPPKNSFDKKIEFFKIHSKTISVTTFYENGLIHRLNGPAVVSSDGHTGYYEFGKPHNEAGPAIIHSSGNKLHFYKGLLHNECGAAINYKNGYKAYYVMGRKFTPDEYFDEYFIY